MAYTSHYGQSLTAICENVNKFFLLMGEKKFNFIGGPPTGKMSRDEEGLYKQERGKGDVVLTSELIKLFEWILSNMEVIILNKKNAAGRVKALLKMILLSKGTYHNLCTDDELDKIEWPFRMINILIGLLNTFQYGRDWKRNISDFYTTRGQLLEIVIMLTFANEAFINAKKRLNINTDIFIDVKHEKSRFYLESLRQTTCLFIRQIIRKLPSFSFFDMAEEIVEEHGEWLINIFYYYIIEGKILDKRTLWKEDEEIAKTTSIVKNQEHLPEERALIYYLGLIGDTANAAFGIPTKNILPRPAFGRHHEYLFNLCSYLMRNISVHHQLDIKERAAHYNEVKITNWSSIIDNLLLYDTDDKTKSLLILLSHLLKASMTIITRFRVKAILKEDEIEDLRRSLNDRHIDNFDFHITHVMMILLKVENGNAPIIVKLDFPEIEVNDIKDIFEELKELRKTCFRSVANFCIKFSDIFFCNDDQLESHERWLTIRLLPMLEVAKKLDEIERDKGFLRFSRLLLKGDPFNNNNQ